ncbi:hypothetical protein [Glycomyces harbinensis]|uniref:Uncharacterized protein n=1 Tax=Glycomyces harbinensis TaxID=58114 RepID=A0A1G6V7L4_9ACTN|nr:hypothetical protein [Glycomyces harbinensis]SDD49680.1 hypothetical protein SAMN05216270_104264 [Glycomyces harbinensis]
MRRYKIALLLGLMALTASACGSDDGDGGVASADGDATESASEEGEDLDGFEEALAYSECMRDNGIADFPDPEEQGEGGISLGLPEGMDPESEEFKAAEEACEDMQPGPDENATIDPEVYQALVEYSECMRENGIAEFPDPTEGGGIIMNGDMGFDPQSEEFQAAEEACADLRPEGRGEGPENDGEDG